MNEKETMALALEQNNKLLEQNKSLQKEVLELQGRLKRYEEALETIRDLCKSHEKGEKIVFAQEILDIINKTKDGK